MSDFELIVMIAGNVLALILGRIVGGFALAGSILFLRGVSPLVIRTLVFYFIFVALMLIGIPLIVIPVFGVLGVGLSDPLPAWVATNKNQLPTLGTWLLIGLGSLWIIGFCWATITKRHALKAIEVWR